MRRLSRRRLAEPLSHVPSAFAYRGIVHVARDPDSEIRVKVRHSLENDPDRKVRTYTHWTLERLRAKEL